MRIATAIIAGGNASRLGYQPKGLLEVGGKRILDRLVDVCHQAFGAPPLLVANAPNAIEWTEGRLRTVPDAIRGRGALGGLYTAVREAPAPVICLAWDLPFVTAPLLERLAEGLDRCDAFFPASESNPGLEPLCAAYGPACLGPMLEAIRRNDLRAVAFHDRVTVGILTASGVAALGNPSDLLFNVNTPNDLVEANRIAARLGST